MKTRNHYGFGLHQLEAHEKKKIISYSLFTIKVLIFFTSDWFILQQLNVLLVKLSEGGLG